MRRALIGGVVVRAAAFALLWWMLLEGRNDGWGLGAIALAAALLLSLRLSPPGERSLSPTGLAGFVAFFLWHSLQGGVQVAALALRPRARPLPELLEVPLALPPGAPRVLMTTAIGLLPGTLGVCLEGDRLRLHVLDRRLPAVAEAEALQRRIACLFGAAR
ncbi:MAG: hypothetical protein CALGDGBN_00295 [Pseudomonadales bacterium]|nr:hypothetical protein [Pseudomonadales bacterium]